MQCLNNCKQNKKTLTIKNGYRAVDFFHFARDHLFSAASLFQKGHEEVNIGYFDSGIYLCHLTIELLLKSIALSLKKECLITHCFNCLLAELNLNLSDESLKTINWLQEYWDNRYPKPGSAPEVGDDDYHRVSVLWKEILTLRPQSLIKDWEEIKNSDVFEKNGRILCFRKNDEYFDDAISIDEAAKYLGITKQTLRNWDKSKKLVANRNPQNNYRVYKRSNLAKLKNLIVSVKPFTELIK